MRESLLLLVLCLDVCNLTKSFLKHAYTPQTYENGEKTSKAAITRPQVPVESATVHVAIPKMSQGTGTFGVWPDSIQGTISGFTNWIFQIVFACGSPQLPGFCSGHPGLCNDHPDGC